VIVFFIVVTFGSAVTIVFLLFSSKQVALLYRKSLKLLASWAIDRDIINEEATKIRARFDQERGCKPEKALRLLRVSSFEENQSFRGL